MSGRAVPALAGGTPPPPPDRSSFIGGSDIAAIAGVSDFGSAFDVYLEKTGRAGVREAPALSGRSPLYWGKRLERIIAETYAQQTGRPLVYLFDEPCVHPDRAWHGGSPDALDYTVKAVVDSKNVGLQKAHLFGEPGSDEMPDGYAVQLAWYMSLKDFERAVLAVLIGGQDFRVYDMVRNRELEERLLEIGYAFWRDHVQADIPPPITATDTAKDYLRRMFPHEQLGVRDATPVELTAAVQLAEVKERASVLAQAEGDLAAALKLAIAEHEGIIGRGVRVTWKAPKPTTVVDWEAVAKEALGALALIGGADAAHADLLRDAARAASEKAVVTKWTTLKPNTRRLLVNVDQKLLKGDT